MYSVRSLELDDAGTAQGETKPKSHPIYIRAHINMSIYQFINMYIYIYTYQCLYVYSSQSGMR